MGDSCAPLARAARYSFFCHLFFGKQFFIRRAAIMKGVVDIPNQRI